MGVRRSEIIFIYVQPFLIGLSYNTIIKRDHSPSEDNDLITNLITNTGEESSNTHD